MTSDISLSSPNLLPQEDADYLCSLIRTIPDFPSEGILFRDFMPVFAQAKSMNLLIQGLVNALPVMPSEFDYIAGLEARGFLIGTALAQKLDKGFIAVRKAGKLPPPVLSQSYDLEYGKATMEIEKDLVNFFEFFPKTFDSVCILHFFAFKWRCLNQAKMGHA